VTAAGQLVRPVFDTGTPALSDREFRQFQQLIHREAGINLTPGKQALLVGRLSRRIRELGLRSFGEYHQAIVGGLEGELVRMLDLISTNETSFFREPGQFELLAGAVCDEWEKEATLGLRAPGVRVWSAACSSGEEPYSIAMVLHERLVRQGWHVEIVASDLSTRVLKRAQVGTWLKDRARSVPARYRRYLMQGVGQENLMVHAVPEIKSLIRFDRINLVGDRWPFSHGFDAVFCRNVLIYFDAATRSDVAGRLLQTLVPGGYLFLGHAESLAGTPHRETPVLPSVYRTAIPR
jgi:chemotaxis protein methyltransferase CheR